MIFAPVALVEEVGVAAADLVPKGLKIQPAGLLRADSGVGVFGPLVSDQLGFTRRLRKQLALAAAFHGDEPERRRINALAHAEQAVILVDGCFAVIKVPGEALAGFLFQHHLAAVFADQGVVVEEHAGILRDRIEVPAQAGKGPAVWGMGVGRGIHFRSTLMDRGMQHEGRPVDRTVADHHLAGMVHQDQVADSHPPK